MDEFTQGKYTATRHLKCWDELLFHLCQLDSSLGFTRASMLNLKNEYQRSLGSSALIFYPKKNREGKAPCALSLKGLFSVPETEGRPSVVWLKHIPHLTLRVIYVYAKDYRRHETYFEFDRHRLALNDAHSELSHASSRVWKILKGRYRPRLPRFSTFRPLPPPPLPPMPPSPAPALAHLPSYTPRLLAHAWHLVQEIVGVELQLLELSELQRKSPRHPAYSLGFERDHNHPFGRLRWRDECGRVVDMTYRGMRKCRPPRKFRIFLAAFEIDRRQLTRRHQALTGVFHRITSIISAALRAFRIRIDEAAARSAVGNEVFPLDPRWEARPGANQGMPGSSGDELL